MDPVEIPPEDRSLLPDHHPQVWAGDGQPDPVTGEPLYRPLPSVILHGSKGEVITRWTFTPEERARIAAGEDLYLCQLTFLGPLQPILPAVGIDDALHCR